MFGVIHQGRGEEDSGAPADCIWSHRWSLATPMTMDGKQLQDYHTEPELLGSSLTTIGVICHEMGHAFNLPDLYDTTYASQGVGIWSIMAGGSWCGPSGNGAKPCHMDPWSKLVLGWITPTVVTTPQTAAAMPAFDTNASALLIPVDPYRDGEYFLLCNRFARTGATAGTGFDQYLPGSGALLLHVDDYTVSNDNEVHKKVDVEEADGLAQLDSNTNSGNAGDLYPAGNTSFTDATNPNARDYTGANTGIVINSFVGSGTANMTCNITPRASYSGDCIAYDESGASDMSIGNDPDDFGCVRFTTVSGGTLKRVKTCFVYSGTTNYTVKVFSGFGSNLPTGLLGTMTGSNTGVGAREIDMPAGLVFSAGATFYVEVEYATQGAGYSWSVPVATEHNCAERSYFRSTSTEAYIPLTVSAGYPWDINIRADMAPPVNAADSYWMLTE